VAKRQRAGNQSLNEAAENIGAALGQVAARLDRWTKERASIAADLRRLMQSATGMLADLGGQARRTGGRRKGGRPQGSKVSDATKEKLRAAWERRRAAASGAGAGKKHTKPPDQRGTIRSKASRTWSNRQPGRG
jgi:hypothetical protein